MCLVIGKPKGLPLLGKKKMRTWFGRFPDGFGLAFQDGNKVRVLKGAMNEKQMFQVIDLMEKYLHKQDKTVEDVDIIFQFRAAMTGSVCPEFCHPFPITDDRKALNGLNVITDVALAHNGVIWKYNDLQFEWNYYSGGKLGDVNDAQEFIVDYLVGMGDSLWESSVQKLIGDYTDSKFALLSNRGIDYIGEFVEDGGYFYSNLGYLTTKKIQLAQYKASSNYFGGWGDEAQAGWKGKDGEDGGIVCDFCGQVVSKVYFMPDDESQVCSMCFELSARRKPTEDERAI